MRSKQKRLSHSLILLIMLLSAPLVTLGFGGGGPGGRPGGKPPREAFEACENKEESDSCTVQTPRGEMSGSCQSMQGDLACAPDRSSSGNDSEMNSNQGQSGRRRPPQEAFDACNDLEENASCTVETPRGDMSGTCRSLQGQLACAPNRNKR